jgi:hypothetical protein
MDMANKIYGVTYAVGYRFFHGMDKVFLHSYAIFRTFLLSCDDPENEAFGKDSACNPGDFCNNSNMFCALFFRELHLFNIRNNP